MALLIGSYFIERTVRMEVFELAKSGALTPNQIKFFDQNGYIVFNEFFSKDEMEVLKGTYSNLIRSRLKKAGLNPDEFKGKEFHEGAIALENTDHEYIAELYDTSFQMPQFLRISGKFETLQVVSQLLKVPLETPLYTFTSRIRLNIPHDTPREYDWHQEVFASVPKSNFLQTWAPLFFPTTEETGTIEFLPGSHKEGIAKQYYKDWEGKCKYFVNPEVVEPYLKNKMSATLEVGQILVFSPLLFHKSGKNISNEVRYSLVGMYHDATTSDFVSPRVGLDYRGMTHDEYFQNYDFS